MTYDVIIPAAGRGERMGAGKNKLFIELKSVPIIVHTLKVFENDERCEQVILVINMAEKQIFKSMISKYKFKKVVALIPGGKERQQSVANGLQAIKKEKGIVLIHDGARPFITKEVIHKLVYEAKNNGAAVVAVPVKDTIKKVHNNVVKETIERSSLWSIQTPQAFRVTTLRSAHKKAAEELYFGTDDASLVEYNNERVTVVEGSYDNIKLTTPEDIYFAEAILRKGEQL